MFIDKLTDLSASFAGDHNLQLVLLSVMVAGLAANIAFLISDEMSSVQTRSPWLWRSWWLCGALVMGGGFWSMHTISVLALSFPVPFSLGPLTTLLSVIPVAVAATYILKIERGFDLQLPGQLIAAVVLGAGITLMHFTGMAAIRMNATISYDVVGFGLSVVLAVALSFLALKIKWKVEQVRDRKGLKDLSVMGSALVMGAAIIAFHYIAMTFTYFLPAPEKQLTLAWQWMSAEQLSWALAATGILISLLVFALVHLSYRFELVAMVANRVDYTRDIINKSSDGIIATDNKGRIKSFNKTAEEIFGYSADYAIGRHCLFLLPEKLQDSHANLLSSSDPNLPQLINRTHEMLFCRSNGAEFPAELTLSPAQENGRLVFVGVIRDTSERKRLQAEKQKFQEKLEFLITASPVVIYTRRVTGSLPINYVSPNIQKIIGYAPEDITDNGNFWLDLVEPEDRELALPDLKNLHDSEHEHIEYRVRFADGNYRWIADTRSLICDENGKPTVMTGSWADIHDKKTTEVTLVLNEERLSICLELANMASWDWVIESGEVVWSESMLDKLGLTEESAMNFDTFINAVHPEDAKSVKGAFKQSLVSGENFDLEYRVVWPDRSIHWLRSVGGLVNDAEGNPIRMVGVLYDISEQKNLHLAPELQQQETV